MLLIAKAAPSPTDRSEGGKISGKGGMHPLQPQSVLPQHALKQPINNDQGCCWENLYFGALTTSLEGDFCFRYPHK